MAEIAPADSLGLSDADFLNQDASVFLTDEPDQASEAEAGAGKDTEADPDKELPDASGSDNDEDKEDEATSTDKTDEDSEAQEQTEDGTKEEEVGQSDGDTQKKHETSFEGDDSESLDTGNVDSKDTKGDNPETTEFDYKSAYEKVTEPFKANGVDMRVKDPADIVRLMQMGANYTKKMAQMKPNLKIIKMLDNNGLLNEGKLHELIDLSKKDPAAVAKLVKESGLDPLDIDASGKADDYKPTDYSVGDKEFELDQVLESIKDTDTFTKTIDVLTKDWDSESKAIISDNPEIISVVNVHMGNGVFDKVNAVMQQQKSLGKLVGVSDVEAYRQIAEDLQKAGELRVNPDAANTTESKDTEDKSQADADRAKKRKAVAPVKQSKSTKDAAVDNLLGLSDEDFMKRFGDR